MKTFIELYGPVTSLIGESCHKELINQLNIYYAKRPLIVTDEGIAKTGILNKITSLLTQGGLTEYTLFTDVHPNPTIKDVHAGLAVYKENNCDSLISLGGGSPHDCAKAIGMMVTNPGVITDYEGIDKLYERLPPLIAINTTAGTASEMTKFSVITDEKTHHKMVIVDRRLTPKVAINDPLLMLSLPPKLTKETGIDALVHAIEAYVSKEANYLTDACALQAISLIYKNLEIAATKGHDLEARTNMAFAQYLAGLAFNNAGLGYIHALSHQLSGYYNLSHGFCNAILLVEVCSFNNIPSTQKRFKDMGLAMGLDLKKDDDYAAANKAIEALKNYLSCLDIPQKISHITDQELDFKEMAISAQKDACSQTNPRKALVDDLIDIYKKCY